MNYLLVFVCGISLSMDAFAVAVCKGLTLNKVRWRDCIIVGTYFGLFQGLMPLGGYFLASSFKEHIERFDHWIAFALLLYIGGKMIFEGFHPDEAKLNESDPLSFVKMLPMAVATSIDALAVGIAFFCDGMTVESSGFYPGVFVSCAMIAVTTFVISLVGVKIGKLVGDKFRAHAELVGGIILVLLGVKILVEHTLNISLFGF